MRLFILFLLVLFDLWSGIFTTEHDEQERADLNKKAGSIYIWNRSLPLSVHFCAFRVFRGYLKTIYGIHRIHRT